MTDGVTFTSVAVFVVSLTAGSAFLMWLGEQITEKGVGNGISIILLYNIVSRMPEDMMNLSRSSLKVLPMLPMVRSQQLSFLR